MWCTRQNEKSGTRCVIFFPRRQARATAANDDTYPVCVYVEKKLDAARLSPSSETPRPPSTAPRSTSVQRRFIKQILLGYYHLLGPPPPIPLRHTLPLLALLRIAQRLVSGPISGQLLNAPSPDDGGIQQKSSRQRPNLSLPALFLHLRVSLHSFVFVSLQDSTGTNAACLFSRSSCWQFGSLIGAVYF